MMGARPSLQREFLVSVHGPEGRSLFCAFCTGCAVISAVPWAGWGTASFCNILVEIDRIRSEVCGISSRPPYILWAQDKVRRSIEILPRCHIIVAISPIRLIAEKQQQQQGLF